VVKAAAGRRKAGQVIVFFFFSSRLGCVGSLVISAVITIVLLFLFGVFR
jgi:hypothetical protein